MHSYIQSLCKFNATYTCEKRTVLVRGQNGIIKVYLMNSALFGLSEQTVRISHCAAATTISVSGTSLKLQSPTSKDQPKETNEKKTPKSNFYCRHRKCSLPRLNIASGYVKIDYPDISKLTNYNEIVLQSFLITTNVTRLHVNKICISRQPRKFTPGWRSNYVHIRFGIFFLYKPPSSAKRPIIVI